MVGVAGVIQPVYDYRSWGPHSRSRQGYASAGFLAQATVRIGTYGAINITSSTIVAGLIAISEVDLLVGVGVVLISAVALGSP